MNLAILGLLGVSLLCLVCGLWIGYRDRRRGRQRRKVVLPTDEEILIFDRVTEGLSQIPTLDNPGALWSAKKEVMERVGEQYGLKSGEVGVIYWRVWRWRHESAR